MRAPSERKNAGNPLVIMLTVFEDEDLIFDALMAVPRAIC